MSYDAVVNKVVINYLHYVNKKSVEEATLLYKNNRREFDVVIDILGTEFIVGLLESITASLTKKKRKGKEI